MTESLFRRRRDADPDVLSLLVFFLNDLRSVYHLPTSTHDLHLLETGRLSEAEFFRRLCARHEEAGGPHLDPERARALIFAERAEASAAMVDTVRQLRSAGYRTALLTNNAREWEPMWRNLIPVDELFDVVVDSSVVGLRKPDPAIYELTCSRLGLRPDECIFVDDLQCNVDVAAVSDAGPLRAENQDAWAVLPLDPRPGCAVLLADGMGGHADGAVAAYLAVHGAGNVLRAGGDPHHALADAVGEANEAIARHRASRAGVVAG